MKFLTLAFVLVSFSSFAADKVVLTCSTAGDGLDAVEFIQRGSSSIVKVSQLDDSSVEYTLRTDFKNILKGDGDTVIGYTDKSQEFGGAITDAALIRVTPSKKSAFLSVNGIIYKLNCF